MGSTPNRFEKSLNEYGYHCEVDLRKCDCRREPPHWHLVKGSSRIAQIWTSPVSFERIPGDINSKIRDEVLELTERYRYDIEETYRYNAENGSDY